MPDRGVCQGEALQASCDGCERHSLRKHGEIEAAVHFSIRDCVYGDGMVERLWPFEIRSWPAQKDGWELQRYSEFSRSCRPHLASYLVVSRRYMGCRKTIDPKKRPFLVLFSASIGTKVDCSPGCRLVVQVVARLCGVHMENSHRLTEERFADSHILILGFSPSLDGVWRQAQPHHDRDESPRRLCHDLRDEPRG